MRQVFDDSDIPYDTDEFDIVINRHEAYDVDEVGRILKSGGYFITQQVGGRNNKEGLMKWDYASTGNSDIIFNKNLLIKL